MRKPRQSDCRITDNKASGHHIHCHRSPPPPLPQLIQLLYKSSLRHSCTMGVKRSKLRYIHVDAHALTHLTDTKKWRRYAHGSESSQRIKDLTDRHLA